MGTLTCWLLDTRNLWPGDSIEKSASAALQLISQDEREHCKRKYHIADAKMALASALLKRLFVLKTLGIPWHTIQFGRKRDPKYGKPCALLPDGSIAPIEFNVSHQAGLVALVGCSTADIELGVDIVCVNERNDYRLIDQEGFDGWVDVYQEIFSPEESWDMKYNTDPFKLLDGTVVSHDELGRNDRCCLRNQELVATLKSGEKRKFSSDLLVGAKLRRFYTFWCYKEAYIKLDGEALLAKWIKELEFKNVRAPTPGTPARCSTHGVWGERVTDVEVWLHGKRVHDLEMEIVAFEEDFMLGIAAKSENATQINRLPGFELLHLEEDILGPASVSFRDG
ncbi:4'-phosphopantetheinyl transferase [Delitschia confertaspora ATCC 74209]|uniref:holo-[acyl-carrier-protein] synthase n=1 Tax=Delitschia confertaspora ATCC 74209 TaxID=1513339 RepID=A0A9P4JZB3_9PLEO|nr:4'-phosphopantetheinyl transferase [Delitschia confertaspora ATCC 74209]